MNNSEKAELFAALQALSESIPEMRAGQLVAAVGELCADLHGRGLWDATDEELRESAWQFQRNYEAAMQTAAKPQAEPDATPARGGTNGPSTSTAQQPPRQVS